MAVLLLGYGKFSTQQRPSAGQVDAVKLCATQPFANQRQPPPAS